MYDASCKHIYAKENVWYKEKLGMPFAFSLVKTEAPTYVNTLEHILPAPFVKKKYITMRLFVPTKLTFTLTKFIMNSVNVYGYN